MTRAPVRPEGTSELVVLRGGANRLRREVFGSLNRCLHPNSYLILGSAHIVPTEVCNIGRKANTIIRFLLISRGRGSI